MSPGVHAARQRLYADYDKHARSPIDLDGGSFPYFNSLVRTHFPLDRAVHILDLGCGNGTLLRAAACNGYTSVRGVDGSPAMVREAIASGAIGAEQGDINEALRRCASASVDVIVAFDVLEHLDLDQQLEMLDDAHRVLKGGGRLILHVPNGDSPFGASVRFGDATHTTAFTTTSLAQLLFAAGFRSHESFEDQPAFGRFLREHARLRALAMGVMRGAWTLLCGGLYAWTFIETATVPTRKVYTRNLLTVAFK